MHWTALDWPTPRGSKPIKSNRASSPGTSPARNGRKSMPEAPGPPGLVSREPTRLCCAPERMRMRAMLMVLPSVALPSLAVFQSIGTVTLPHWTDRLLGSFEFFFSASAPHDCQSIDPIGPVPVGAGWVSWGLWKLQPLSTTARHSVAARMTRRRTWDSSAQGRILKGGTHREPSTAVTSLRVAGEHLIDVE